MAPNEPDLSLFLNPNLCANTDRCADGELSPCPNHASLACGKCKLVQYCSKDCQVADWPRHRFTCKSALMKEHWTPDWFIAGRKPAFIGSSLSVPFGTTKYLWGNMPALDILQVNDNEGIADKDRHFSLLFAASGDLRNVIKSVVGLPGGHMGGCTVAINDKDFVVVARNVIMLLIALQFDPEAAVPMIIHLWYSALLPADMVLVLRSHIQPLIGDVCAKIHSKPEGSLQAKTFTIGGRKLRLMLSKENWVELLKYLDVPGEFTAENSRTIRQRVTCAPERVDYRERSMLQWSPALRQGEKYFREEGVLLPYGCSLNSFDTPNPTFFQTSDWPMKDSASPRQGWLYSDYVQYAPAATADEFGALFFYVRKLLLDFCHRVHKIDVSFELFHVNAQSLPSYIGYSKFDRIEISNMCDMGYLGPRICLETFSDLLKPKSQNPKATLLMLFLNAAAETEYNNRSPGSVKADMATAMMRLEKYMPLDRSRLAQIRNADDLGKHPHFVRRSACYDMFKNWEKYFDLFLYQNSIDMHARSCGLQLKDKHTIVEPWPYKVGPRTTQKEFDILRASSTVGYERYVEFEKTD
ncbi:hypothetical protein P153DRAFT_430843 [Dothidotthia symphoricarpi CBS 119687]|uniref:MYND-type domain-containing protein n=1 Tax=Dothidotthia symphoricarpi CBS 119687 TaxID=1392245 RepID=A0A6A6AD74_9PLEO|nr:uncharacterized protein P153DRAFT_430843 [Dothidotthia symphoricarpi CBS 119687]KAF2129720.1 hypothetical protein P153DRAFT_430843 [Dothidotthia symphoricarpi CBS 119687]